jgi:hypothetical protein
MTQQAIINEAFLSQLETRTRDALIAQEYNPGSIVNPATVLLLIAELQKTRSALAAVGREGDYQQGYKDGWIDARLTPPQDCKPVAWAVVVRGDRVVKVYSEAPEKVGPGMECRPLFIQPQISASTSLK